MEGTERDTVDRLVRKKRGGVKGGSSDFDCRWLDGVEGERERERKLMIGGII